MSGHNRDDEVGTRVCRPVVARCPQRQPPGSAPCPDGTPNPTGHPRSTQHAWTTSNGAMPSTVGQPVIVPGDMGRYSFVLVGTQTAMRETFGSTCHGAGRVMSRTAAVKAARGRRIVDELAQRGVVARAAGHQSLAEEMPEAYKDVREVVDVVHGFGISTRVARLKPLGVIKG